MFLAYSAWELQEEGVQKSTVDNKEQIQLRREAYQTVCSKYKDEIAAIRKYIPNWN